MKALNILVAEDNPDHAELILDVLEECNAENVIRHVTNGRDLLNDLNAVADASEGPVMLPDLILLDVKMPLVNGMETLKVLKTHNIYKSIPVIVLSTSAHENDVEECYLLGANSYITKPFDSSAFESKLREINVYWSNVAELPR